MHTLKFNSYHVFSAPHLYSPTYPASPCLSETLHPASYPRIFGNVSQCLLLWSSSPSLLCASPCLTHLPSQTSALALLEPTSFKKWVHFFLRTLPSVFGLIVETLQPAASQSSLGRLFSSPHLTSLSGSQSPQTPFTFLEVFSSHMMGACSFVVHVIQRHSSPSNHASQTPLSQSPSHHSLTPGPR